MIDEFAKTFWKMCIMSGFSLGLLFIMIGSMDNDFSVLIFCGFISIAFGCYSLYHLIYRKEIISKDLYDRFMFNNKCYSLSSKKIKYLEIAKNDKDYLALQELFSHLPRLYNDYASAILNTPLSLTKPVSPYTAGYIGTQIGGVAVGMVAAQNAIEKQKAYEQNVKDVIKSEITKGNALDKLKYCYTSIEAIINKNENIRADWEWEKKLIVDNLNKQYKVR